VLGAVDDKHEAVLVHVSDVARTQEAVKRRDISRRFFVLPVAFHNVRPLDAEFSALAEWDIFRWFIEAEELDDDARHRHSAGTGLAPAVDRRESSGRRGLRHAPAFAQIAAGNCGE